LMVKSGALVGVGRRREGMGLLTLVREIASEHGSTDMLIRATGNLGGYMSDIDLGRSLELYREGLSLARRAGHRDMVLQGTSNIGYAGFLNGEWDEAIAELDAALAETLAPRDELLLLNNALIIRAARGEDVTGGLARLEQLGREMSGTWHLFVSDPAANAAAARGDLKRARESYLEVADTDPGQGPEYFYRAARMALWERDLAAARELAGKAQELGGYGPLMAARRATIAAGIAALEGRSAEALALYRDAHKGWRATHAVWDEALTGIDMAELLDPADPEVAAAAEASRDTLQRLRAVPYLERLQRAVARAESSDTASPERPAERAPVTARD
jgi:tetratricopeptide (TPR) repeat protein